jgi:hypothetical protein
MEGGRETRIDNQQAERGRGGISSEKEDEKEEEKEEN